MKRVQPTSFSLRSQNQNKEAWSTSVLYVRSKNSTELFLPGWCGTVCTFPLQVSVENAAGEHFSHRSRAVALGKVRQDPSKRRHFTQFAGEFSGSSGLVRRSGAPGAAGRSSCSCCKSAAGRQRELRTSRTPADPGRLLQPAADALFNRQSNPLSLVPICSLRRVVLGFFFSPRRECCIQRLFFSLTGA